MCDINCHVVRLHDGLREYAEYVKARNADSDNLLVYDPRSEEEKLHAALLQQQATADNKDNHKIGGTYSQWFHF